MPAGDGLAPYLGVLVINPGHLQHAAFYGWTNLAGIMLVYGGLCGNITYAYGVFLPTMSESFGWSRSAFSGPYAAFLIIGGLLGPMAGMTIARFGARRNIILSNLVAGLGLLGMSQVSDIWHVYIYFGLMAGIGIGFGEFIPLTTIINHWFIHRRSLAMGFLFASGGLGGFLMPPLISWFISGLSWRWAWVCLALLHLLLTVLAGGLLIRNRPEDMGQVPDDKVDLSGNRNAHWPKRGQVYQTPTDWTVREALRTPALWMIVTLFSIILFVTNMLTTHQVAYLQDQHYTSILSATALGLMLGMSVIGRLVCGVLGIKFEGRYLAAFFMGIMGLGILALMYPGGIIFVYLYSVLTGIGFGGMIVLMPNLIGAYFGRSHYSRIVGWTVPVVTLSSAVSPSLAGVLYDRTGEYVIPFAMAAALAFAGMMIAFLTRPPQQQAP